MKPRFPYRLPFGCLGKSQPAKPSRIGAIAPNRPEGFVLRAMWHRQQGDLTSALRCCDDAVARRGRDTEPLLLRAMILEELGQLGQSQECYQTVLQEDPGNETATQALSTFGARHTRTATVPTGE